MLKILVIVKYTSAYFTAKSCLYSVSNKYSDTYMYIIFLWQPILLEVMESNRIVRVIQVWTCTRIYNIRTRAHRCTCCSKRQIRKKNPWIYEPVLAHTFSVKIANGQEYYIRYSCSSHAKTINNHLPPLYFAKTSYDHVRSRKKGKIWLSKSR